MKTNFTLTKKSNNKFIALITCAVLTIGVSAQGEKESQKHEKISGGIGHFNFGIQQNNISGLNNSLAANGYNQINTVSFSYGGGGLFAINNFLIGGEGSSLINSQAGNTTNQINVNGGSGFFNVGYIIYSNKHSILYPTLGFGGGGFDIEVSKNNVSGDFSQQLTAPTGMIRVQAGGWMANVQLSYQYFFNKNNKNGFYIGLKAGYNYSSSSWRLKVNNTNLDNSPKINMNGFYATVVLGGGGLFARR